tara:strand:+ start:249 stop:470 length:222 start_codon:yes stop_codon:yes gene_type:complete
MAKKQKEKSITIDGKDYKESDFTIEQINMINHVSDLDRKLQTSVFNLEQLQFGRDCYMDKLTKSLKIKKKKVA